MEFSAAGSVLTSGNQSSGRDVRSLFALAPAMVAALMVPAIAENGYSIGLVTYAHTSIGYQMGSALGSNAQLDLRAISERVFSNLLESQTDIEPDIAAIVYSSRGDLYAEF